MNKGLIIKKLTKMQTNSEIMYRESKKEIYKNEVIALTYAIKCIEEYINPVKMFFIGFGIAAALFISYCILVEVLFWQL